MATNIKRTIYPRKFYANTIAVSSPSPYSLPIGIGVAIAVAELACCSIRMKKFDLNETTFLHDYMSMCKLYLTPSGRKSKYHYIPTLLFSDFVGTFGLNS